MAKRKFGKGYADGGRTDMGNIAFGMEDFRKSLGPKMVPGPLALPPGTPVPSPTSGGKESLQAFSDRKNKPLAEIASGNVQDWTKIDRSADDKANARRTARGRGSAAPAPRTRAGGSGTSSTGGGKPSAPAAPDPNRRATPEEMAKMHAAIAARDKAFAFRDKAAAARKKAAAARKRASAATESSGDFRTRRLAELKEAAEAPGASQYAKDRYKYAKETGMVGNRNAKGGAIGMAKGGRTESPAMVKKELDFFKKKKAPKSMIKHEEAELKQSKGIKGSDNPFAAANSKSAKKGGNPFAKAKGKNPFAKADGKKGKPFPKAKSKPKNPFGFAKGGSIDGVAKRGHTKCKRT